MRKGYRVAGPQADKGGITAYAEAAGTRLDASAAANRGFVDVVTRDVETNGVSSPPLILDDIDSVFIHECVTACNARVLELQEAHLEKEVLLLCLKRFMRTREVPQEDLEIRSLRQALKLFLLKGMLFKRALKIISENHFPGLRILYDDTTKALAKGNRSAQRMRAIFFNEELAPAFGVEPITRVELDEYLCAAAPREGALRGQR